MPVSPLGNINYINQNMAYPATQASNELAKEGFAATLNMAEFNEKEKLWTSLRKSMRLMKSKKRSKKKPNKKKKEKHNQEAKTSDDEKNEEDESKDPNFKDAQSIHRLDISI